jgi:replicative DNA helicase
MIEENILSAIIKDQRCDIMPELDTTLFTDPINKQVADLFLTIWTEKKRVDDTQVFMYLKEKKILSGAVFSKIKEVMKLDMILPSDWRSRLVENNDLQCLKRLQTELKTDQPITVKKEILFDCYEQIFKRKVERNYLLVDEIDKYIQKLKEGEKDQLNENAIPLSSCELKTLIGDYVFPFPYCISSRPGGYKTSFLFRLMRELLRWPLHDRARRGMFFSFEDNIDAVRTKFIAQTSKLDKKDLMLMNYQPEQIKYEELQSQMVIIDKKCTVNQFVQAVKRQMATSPVDFIMIDYIQRFRTVGNKLETMMDATDAILDITKDHMIPVIYTSQLGRNNEAKWSGTIEEEARFFAKLEEVEEKEVGKDHYRRWTVEKDTWGKKGRSFDIEFTPQTGDIYKTYYYDDETKTWYDVVKLHGGRR